MARMAARHAESLGQFSMRLELNENTSIHAQWVFGMFEPLRSMLHRSNGESCRPLGRRCRSRQSNGIFDVVDEAANPIFNLTPNPWCG